MEKKFIVYIKERNGKSEVEKINEAQEQSVPAGDISLWKLFWYSLTDKGLMYWLSNTVKYALRHHDCYRGYGASDVIMFELKVNSKKIWKNGNR